MRLFAAARLLLIALLPAAASAQAPVDGVFVGGADISGAAGGRAANGRCNQTMRFTLHVRDRSFVWRLPTSQVPVAIAPDGSFSAQNGSRFINGRIQGTHLAAQTTGRGCSYVWSLDRQ